MKRKFVIEIETENEVNVTTAEDVHLALVKYFVMGVYIRVEEAAQQSVQQTVNMLPMPNDMLDEHKRWQDIQEIFRRI